MFTGLIEEVGSVDKVTRLQNGGWIEVKATKVLEGTKLGDSIAVNGVCLTVDRLGQDGFGAEIMPETLRKTNLGQLRPHMKVNLERALMAGDRMGGHIVSGHVDGTGIISRISQEGRAKIMTVTFPEKLGLYFAKKGSVTIDGTSLTIMDKQKGQIQVSLVSHTQKESVISEKKQGDQVNLECDLIARYLDEIIKSRKEESSLENLLGI